MSRLAHSPSQPLSSAAKRPSFAHAVPSASERSSPIPPRIALALFATYLIWGTTYYAIRVALEDMPPLFLMGTRFVAAGGLMLTYLLLRGAKRPSWAEVWNAGKIGFLLITCGMGAVAIAEQSISSGATTAMAGALPLVAAIAAGVDGQWPKRSEWGAILLGTLGVLALSLGDEFRASPSGTLMILFAILAWCFGAQWSTRLKLPDGSMGFAIEMLLGGVLLLIASPLVGEHWSADIGAQAWLAWSYLVALGSIVAFSAYMYLTRTVSPALSASYAYVNPPVALAVGAVLGGEVIAPQTLLGMPLILASVAILAWQARRGAASAATTYSSSHTSSSVSSKLRSLSSGGKDVRSAA